MIEPISTVISLAALAVSSVTAWLTYGRRGTVRMSQPAVIYFGPDGGRDGLRPDRPMVYLRALLFSTAKRGRIIESMHATLRHGEARQNFHIWVYGDDHLLRGSGLFVGETGVAANHHFLTSPDERPFAFTAGDYVLEVHARLLGDRRPVMLLSQRVNVGETEAAALRDPAHGLYFDWGPDAERYLPHIDRKEPHQPPAELLKLLGVPPPASGAP
jgi:hypothetical protein